MQFNGHQNSTNFAQLEQNELPKNDMLKSRHSATGQSGGIPSGEIPLVRSANVTKN